MSEPSSEPGFGSKIVAKFHEEWEHTPICVIGAFAGTADVIWRLFAEVRFGPSTVSTPVEPPTVGIDNVYFLGALTEFVAFQIAMAIAWHGLRHLTMKSSASVQWVTNAFVLVPASFATMFNAFFLAKYLIVSLKVHYSIFEGLAIVSFLLGTILLVVFSIEGHGINRKETFSEWADRSLWWSFGLAAVIFAYFFLCLFIGGHIEDQLEPVWAAATRSP